MISIYRTVCSLTAVAMTGFTLCGCVAPRESTVRTEETPRSDTGTVVAAEGDTITVLIDNKLTKIRLEGFAEEGSQVTDALQQPPTYTRFGNR
jgi:hypothetical protein